MAAKSFFFKLSWKAKDQLKKKKAQTDVFSCYVTIRNIDQLVFSYSVGNTARE